MEKPSDEPERPVSAPARLQLRVVTSCFQQGASLAPSAMSASDPKQTIILSENAVLPEGKIRETDLFFKNVMPLSIVLQHYNTEA
jgi:hypothetical protein